MKLISMVLPTILNSFTVPDLKNYLQSLLISYYDIIIHHNDFSLLPGLTILVHFALDINNKMQTSLIHNEIKGMIKKQLDKIMLICMKFYENIENDNLVDINTLITPIASMFQQDFVEALLDLWKKHSVPRPKVKELGLIIKMTPHFNISPDIIIDIVLNFLTKGPKETVDELIIASFIQNILMILEKFKIPVSPPNL